jgi:hypothetical protein
MDPETISWSNIILPIDDDPTDALPVREALAQASFPWCTVTHGGHIWVEAEPGEGGDVLLDHPRQEVMDHEPANRPKTSSGPPCRR